MLIPLGADGIRRRPPKATLALIALNVLAFLITAPIQSLLERKALRRAEELAFPLILLEAELEAKYVGQGKNVWEWWPPSRFREQTAIEKRFWEDFEAGLVLPKDDPTYVRWRELVDEFEDVIRGKDTLYWKLSYRTGDPTLLGLIASMFIHVNFAHLAGNMVFLWAVGANTEDAWGWRWFLGLYFVGGLVATLVQVLAVSDPEMAMMGASGAVATIMGAFMVRHFTTRIRYFSFLPMGVFRLPAGIMLGLWFVGEMLALFASEGASDGVAFGAHVGGFALGLGFALLVKLERIEEKVIAPDLVRQDRENRRTDVRERARDMHSHGQNARALEEYVKAVREDPADLELRREYFELLRLRKPDVAHAEGVDLLRELWRTGDRAEYLALFSVVDALGDPLGPQLTCRAAQAAEASDPHRAAQLLHRAAQGDPADPMTTKALELYAEVLDRLGAPDSAAQARQLLAARRRARGTAP